jgi:hypothetical protein
MDPNPSKDRAMQEGEIKNRFKIHFKSNWFGGGGTLYQSNMYMKSFVGCSVPIYCKSILFACQKKKNNNKTKPKKKN